MITAVDDGFVRTHDDARDLLRYAALGATVVLRPPQSRQGREEIASRAREYIVLLDGAADYTLSVLDLYTLPCQAVTLARRVRDLCDARRAALAARAPCWYSRGTGAGTPAGARDTGETHLHEAP